MENIPAMEARGEVSPQIRLEKSYLCNFQCSHCSAEHYMDRHKEKVFKIVDERATMTLDDVRSVSRQADELGLARFVLTGGEPLVMRDFDDVIAALDPEKHFIFCDTNGWFLDAARAKHLYEIGVDKMQVSLDSFIEADHDHFRNKPGSWKRVMRAVDSTLGSGLQLLLQTVLVHGRAQTQEFEDMCRFITERGIGLYVTYAKPTGSCTAHTDWTIDKADADAVRALEKRYNVFTHMTPSWGSHKGCITVKGTITVSSAMEIMPCPYIDMSIGNLRKDSLKTIIERGMKNPWLGPHRPDCLIGESKAFQKIHIEKLKGKTLLPLPYGEGFTDHDETDGPGHYPIDEEGVAFTINAGDTLKSLIERTGAVCHTPPPEIPCATATVRGRYFPSVKGLSIPDASRIPNIASALETAAALVARPDLLLNKEHYAPLLWCAKEATETDGYYFEQYGAQLTFNRRPHLGRKSDYWRAGVVT